MFMCVEVREGFWGVGSDTVLIDLCADHKYSECSVAVSVLV